MTAADATPTATETAAARPAATGAPPGLRDTIASEWTKITSLRSTYVTLTIAIALSIAVSTLVCVVAGVTWDRWGPDDRADFDPLLFPFIGSILTAALVPLVGVKAVSAEYSVGMMRLTLTATPRRDRVLLAKAAAVTSVTCIAGTLATVGMFAAGQVVFAAYGLPTASLDSWSTLRVLVAISVLSAVFPVIGTALAFQIRGTAGALTTVLALIFLPGLIGAQLPGWWQRHVLTFLPNQAGDSIALSHVDHSGTYLHPLVAIVVVAGWLAIFLAAAYVSLTRRDA